MLNRRSRPCEPLTSPRRSWARTSVRGLLALVFLVASILGWLMHYVHIQQEAVAAIERAGGGVIYRCNWKNGRFRPSLKPGVPEWLLQWLGQDFFYSVKFACISADIGTLADDTLMARVAQLRDIEALDVTGSKQVTDVGLAHLTALTELHFLYVQGTGVTDAGLGHLKSMKGLQEVNLQNTSVTSGGVEKLQRELNQSRRRPQLITGGE
jgi:hypothetical protein